MEKHITLTDLTEGGLDDALRYAEEIKDASLQGCLNRLAQIDKNLKTRTNIAPDFAPRSFTFVRLNSEGKFMGNGGIIFHGEHDGFGGGGVPTFSVCLTPAKGWQIHT